MKAERAREIERAVFYRYLDAIERDLENADVTVAFNIGRSLGYMQKALQDELSKEVEPQESEDKE